MAVLRSIASLFAATARQKDAAARARQNPDLAAEKPSEAILSALEVIGGAISADGYVFVPSGPKFVRKHGDLKFEIRVQSDRNNIAGERAAIWVHVAIRSHSASAWRRKHSNEWIRSNAPSSYAIFGAQIGNLGEPSSWVEWDFADVTKRQSVVDDLVGVIRARAYTLFAAFDGEIDDTVTLFDNPSFHPEGLISYYMSKGNIILAERALQRYLDDRPQLKDGFDDYHQLYLQDKLPDSVSSIQQGLAAFVVATGLRWNASTVLRDDHQS
jgi:hypothetical protein